MDLQLKGKSVLVTGGSKGIGAACATSLALEGCEVHIASRSVDTLRVAQQQIEKETGHRPQTHSVDVGIEEQRDRLMPVLQDMDILINCAGAIPRGGLEEIDSRRWREAWELKVYGYIDMTRMALAAMKEKGTGVIVNVIGMAGVNPKYSYLCGSVANAALITFTKAVGGHSSHLGSGIRVLGLNPGPTSTDRLISSHRAQAQVKFGDPDRWDELLTDLPFGRPARAAEIADIVTFLASPRASYLTGVVIDADGGAMFN